MEKSKPPALLRSFDDAFIYIVLLAWVAHPSGRGQMFHEFSKAIHERFKEEEIILPFSATGFSLESNTGGTRA